MSLPALAALVIAATMPQTAPQSHPPATTTDRPVDAEPDDIVVKGYRDRPDVRTRAVPPATRSGVRSRTKYEFSERIAQCAARSRLSKPAGLRAVVDGVVNSATQRLAQDRLVRTYITCGESATLLSFTSAPQNMPGFIDFNAPNPYDNVGGGNDAAPLGWSIYDRGAFTVQALKAFAPDLALTRQQVNDPAVQGRFNLRETPRNRMRFPLDRRFFEVAVCMVRVEPRLAVKLALSEGAARFDDMQAALIDRARVCVGGARKVQVDPTQFRFYIADAVYRWAVAARGVDTLIPTTRAAGVTATAGSSPS